MCAITYTYTSHRPIHINPKVSQSSYHFTKLESSNTFKYIKKKSIWNHPDRIRMPGTTQNMGAELGNLSWARHELARRATLEQFACFGCSLSGTPNFPHQNPNFAPLDPKFDPKTYTLD
jgi:hypothetical protein